MQDVNERYSPIFSQLTQDDRDNIDVIWDWNSPRSKPVVQRHRQRIVQQSPKLSIKRHLSNNQIEVFNKLKEELETLKEQTIGQKLHNNNDIPSCNGNNEIKHKADVNILKDVFNDSMEEELLICSQKAEDKLFPDVNTPLNKVSEYVKPTSPHKRCIAEEMTVHKNSNGVVIPLNNIADDSFDIFLETLKEDEFECNKKVAASAKTRMDYPKQQCIDETTRCNAQEIENKRKKAVAKLETKKKQVVYENDSPIKCSPEEIEQKRLQALAKLEAKKQQEIIERKRQEALKRLEMSRRKRVFAFK